MEDIAIIEGGYGSSCTGKVRWGRHGHSIVIKCPIDVEIRDVKSNKIISSINNHDQEVLIARGGVGGKGLTGKGIQRSRWNSVEEKQRAHD
jgi:GTPase involved in cell partitioning and DNA repair